MSAPRETKTANHNTPKDADHQDSDFRGTDYKDHEAKARKVFYKLEGLVYEAMRQEYRHQDHHPLGHNSQEYNPQGQNSEGVSKSPTHWSDIKKAVEQAAKTFDEDVKQAPNSGINPATNSTAASIKEAPDQTAEDPPYAIMRETLQGFIIETIEKEAPAILAKIFTDAFAPKDTQPEKAQSEKALPEEKRPMR